jgi:hypothetical protein
MCFACISEQTTYIINLSVFITETECLLRGTDWVFKSDVYGFALKGLNHYFINTVPNIIWVNLPVIDIVILVHAHEKGTVTAF